MIGDGDNCPYAANPGQDNSDRNSAVDASQDPGIDTFDNLGEFQAGTVPNNEDTVGDGAVDGGGGACPAGLSENFTLDTLPEYQGIEGRLVPMDGHSHWRIRAAIVPNSPRVWWRNHECQVFLHFRRPREIVKSGPNR